MRALKLAPLAAVLAMGGCALLPNSPAAQDALKGAQAAITTYVDVFQPAVLAYGSLPACPAAVLCKDTSVVTNLKAADKAAVAAINAAQGVLEGNPDAGEITAALSAIQSAETTIAASGALNAKGN